MMEKFVMYMNYNYKGSVNYTVTLQKNDKTGAISIITDYGEVVAVCNCGNNVVKVLKDLDDNKYA